MPVATDQFAALKTHAEAILPLQMRDLFDADAERFNRFSLTVDGMTLDYSKNRIVPATMDLLIASLGSSAKWTLPTSFS